MTNEAAERLRESFDKRTYKSVRQDKWLGEALAAERRATVERIRVEFFGSDGQYNPQHFADGDLTVIRLILDEEAAR